MVLNRIFPILWLFAFAAALMPFAAYQAHEFLLSFLLLAGTLVYAVLQNNEIPKLRRFLLPGFAFWVLAFISVLLSQVTYVSFIYFCFFSALPLTFLLTVFVQDKNTFFKYTGIGLAALFAALAVFSFVQYFFLHAWLAKGFVHWPLADPNSFAGLFSLAFFCAFGLMLGGRNRVQSNAGLVLALLFLSVIFLTGSKGALLALFAALAVFVFAARAHVKKHWRCCAMLAAGAALVFLLLSLGGSYDAKAPAAAFLGDTDLSQRYAVWDSTWHIIKDHFWTGTGIGTFFLYYPAYRAGDTHSAGFMAHNDPLQFFSEMGVLAPVLFYGFIIVAIVKTVQKIRLLRPEDPQIIFILAPFCALGAMAAHSHINFHFNILPTLMLAGLLLGFWYDRVVLQRSGFATATQSKQVFAFVLVLMAFVFAALQGSEILTDRARDKIAAGDLQGFAADINDAGRLSFGKNARAFVLASSIPLGILESSKKTLPPAEIKKLSAQAAGLLDHAEKLNPRMGVIYYYRARLAKIAGREASLKQSPEDFLRQALTVDRLNLPARMMLADLMVAEGHKEEAVGVLAVGLNWPNTTPEYVQKTAFLALDVGDMETHNKAMAKMLVAKAGQIATIGDKGGEGKGELRTSRTLE